MKNGQEKWRAWAAAAGMSVLAGGGAWGVELPWVWEGEMAFGRDRTEWVVDLEGAPKRVEVRLEGGGGAFAVDEASWDGAWNGTPLGRWESGTGGWAETRSPPDAVTRHLRFRAVGGAWVLKGVRVAGNDGVARVLFDREDGFVVEEGSQGVDIRARVVNGGGGWFGEDAWECDEGAGHGEGAVFWVDARSSGWHWARVRAGCDGNDEEVEGVIRWWVGNEGNPVDDPPALPARKARAIAEPRTGPIPFARASAPRAAVGEYYAACYGPDGQLLSGKELKAALCRIVNEGTKTNSYDSLTSILRSIDENRCIYLQEETANFSREHLWPESHGIDGRYPAYSDLHHLRACDNTMNSTRGNLDFDNCRDEPDAKEKNGCWYTTRAWEPLDSAKGDVARAMLYMAVRYEVGANPNGDLELVEATGTGPGTNVLGRLSTLLDWNELDPVDDRERKRNETVYTRYQGNRNPFVDHPEWARRVFAPESWTGKTGMRALVAGLDARQRYPWNGLVDIDYEVAIQGGHGEEDVWVDVWGMDRTTGEKVGMRSLSGTGAPGPVRAGRYRMTWDMGADSPELASDNFAVEMFLGGSPASYLVVDMGGGTNASHWSVETWESEPCAGWSEEHKTTKLVLRQIGAGTFDMGSRTEERGRGEDEVLHSVSLTRSYWMGLFEVTQKQWELAMGNNPSFHKGDKRPVEGVSPGTIRGTGTGEREAVHGGVDEESFLGVLRSKTGLPFDLPTEAQWEYACRAGTRTALNSGKDLQGTEECENLAELGRYAGDRNDGKGGFGEHAEVGSYLPNAWGLHDMHGNVAEWCLDWYGAYDTESAENPSGATSGTFRVRRGGDWNHAAQDARSASRGRALPSAADACGGFRVACGVSAGRSQRLAFEEIGVRQADERIALSATATSGGAVAFSVVSGPGVVESGELSFTGTGTVVVRATQGGSDDWWPVHAEQAVEVCRALQRLSFATIGAQTVTNRIVLSATATGGGEVTYSVVSGPGAIEGNVLTFADIGEVVVSAHQTGDAFWAPVSASQTVRVLDAGLLFDIGVDAEIAHGRITPSVLAATEGEMVTVAIEPEEGWKLSKLTVNGETIKGTSFVMPAADVVLSAVFVERVKATYALVETADEFEPGGEYVLVAQIPGLFCSAMRNGARALRIGVIEVEITEEDTVVTDSDSIVWTIAPGAEEGTWTIYNESANVFAASPTNAENHAQLLPSGTNILSLWTLNLDSLPQVKFQSVTYPDRALSRNADVVNDYFAAYREGRYQALPCLYKKGGDVFKVSLDKADGFTVWQGRSSNIVARAKYGTPPYSYVWSGDCVGNNPSLEIPDTLDPGEYAVTLTVRDSEGREISKTISFVVRIPEMQGLTIDGPATVGAGETAAYTCEARYSDGTRLPVSPDWTLVDGDKYASIDSDGVVSAHEVRVKKTVTLQAQFEDVFGSKTIEILPKETDQDVAVATWPLYYSGAGGTDFPMALSVGDFVASTNLSSSYSYSYFTSSGWPSEEANDDFYCEFSVTPTGMWPLKVGEIFYNFRSQTTGPSHVELRYALDNEWISVASTDLGNESGTVTRSWELEALDITVSPGQTLRFRLYAWGASRTSGTLRVNQPLTLYGQLVGMPTNHFAIALSPNKNFEVVQGQAASIVATAVDPFGDVTYQWSSGGAPGVAQANVFTIDSSEVGGPYTVTCNANDGAFDATSQSVSFSIVAPLKYYPVSVDSEIEGGSIVLSHAEAVAGTMVSIAALPDIGMQLKEITINGTPSGTTFPMPATPVVVGARFAELAGATYKRIETADEFEDGADYLVVSWKEGSFTSAMDSTYAGGRIGLEELGLDVGNAISTCSNSLVWTIRKNEKTGCYTIFSWAVGAYVSCDGLIFDGNDPRAQWTLDFSSLPLVQIASVEEPGRYLLRNATFANKYFAAYTFGVAPFLYKKGNGSFSIALEPAADFRIIQGESAAIVAVAYDADGPVEWRWETDGVPGYASGNVFHIDAFALGGPYTVVCSANDGTSDCVAPQQVTFSVVAPEADVPAYIEGGIGVTPGLRVDARAGNGATLEAKKKEWAVWDAAWTEGTARVEATLERPGGAVETLGSGDGGSARGSAEWAPGEDEWGTFTLRLAFWDADGEPLGELLALRVQPMPVERAYAEWVAARGGTMESLPMEEDTDGDGANNWEEYVADTDPLDEGEVFESQVVVGEDGVVRVVPSVVSTGRVYGVRMAGDLQEGDLREAGEWVDLGPGREGIGAELGGGKGGVGFGVVGVSVP